MIRHLVTLFTLALTYSFSFGQTITQVNPASGQVGQTVNVSITGSGTNFTGATQARMRFGSTTILSTSVSTTSPTQGTAQFTIPPTAPLGNYDVRYGFMPYTPSLFAVTGSGGGGSFGYLSGKIYVDDNSNCNQDAGENGVAGLTVEFTPGPYYTLTQADGSFGVWLPLGTYDVTHGTFPGTQDICVSGGNLNVTLTNANDTVGNNNFPLDIIPVTDLSVFGASGPARPGFNHYWQFWVQNVGNQPASGTVYFINDTIPDYKYSNPAPTAVNGDTLQWNFGTILPGNDLQFRVFDSLPANVNLLGTNMVSRVWVGSVTADVNQSNDSIFNSRIITGSYDPNDKTSYDENDNELNGTISPGDSIIRYRIRFQNSGTDTAFNIYVRDTLDPQFDIGSFHTEVASHNYIVTLSGQGEVEWFFPNILLPDSNVNEPGSHGVIFYTLKFDPNYPLGTTFENTAHIYFDFNPPVITNTTSDEINVVSIEIAEDTQITLYPNPATSRINLRGNFPGNEALEIRMLDLEGRTVKRIFPHAAFGQLEASFSVEDLPAGVYMVGVISGEKSTYKKILISK